MTRKVDLGKRLPDGRALAGLARLKRPGSRMRSTSVLERGLRYSTTIASLLSKFAQ